MGVDLGGLEPPTSSLSGKRSNRLSYRSVANRRRPAGGEVTGDAGERPIRSGILGQRHFEATGNCHGGVVDKGENGCQCCQHNGLENADDERHKEHSQE